MIQAGIKNKADFQVISRAEQYISEHPINNILNLEKLLLMMISMLETASRNAISLFFDCYFWGLNKNESDVTLTYIIADWDFIHKVSHQYNKLLCYNLENLQSFIIGFIQEFVVEVN